MASRTGKAEVGSRRSEVERIPQRALLPGSDNPARERGTSRQHLEFPSAVPHLWHNECPFSPLPLLPPANSMNLPEKPAARARLLVVDDNEDMRLSMKLLLEHLGYQVEVAPNGAVALDIQQQRAADVVITDIFMPDTDGLETINAFRAKFPGVRIIAMSGGGPSLREANYLTTASVAGADAVLRKPFSKDSLLKAIEDLASKDK